jgi:hypothetical protein
MEEYVGQKTRGVRTTLAEGVRGVEEKAGQMLDRGGDALRRAEDFLQDTKAHVSGALQAGEDAVRPAPSDRNAWPGQESAVKGHRPRAAAPWRWPVAWCSSSSVFEVVRAGRATGCHAGTVTVK